MYAEFQSYDLRGVPNFLDVADPTTNGATSFLSVQVTVTPHSLVRPVAQVMSRPARFATHLSAARTTTVKVLFAQFTPVSWSSVHAPPVLTVRPSRQWSSADRRPGFQIGAIIA